MSREIETNQVQGKEVSTEGFIPPKVTRDARGQIRWNLPEYTPEQNEQLGITNVQSLFLEKFPEFLEQFTFGADGMVSEENREQAKEYILKKIGKINQFKVLIISGVPLRKKTYQYFEGSHLTAIQKAFGPWGISFDELNISSAEDVKWVTMKWLRNQFGMGNSTLNSLLKGVSIKEGRGSNRHRVTFYDKNEATRSIKGFLEKPNVDPETGRFQDTDGIIWVSLKTLSEETKIDFTTLKRLTSTLLSMGGRGKSNGAAVLFKEFELKEKIETYNSIPQIDKETGEYIDDEGKRWVSAYSLAGRMECNPSIIYTFLNRVNDVPKISARGISKRSVTLFEEERASEVLAQSGYFERRSQNESITPDQANEELMRFLEVKDE